MLVAGIMSGTSADAIDVALVEITGLEWKTRFRLIGFHSVPYPAAVRRKILEIAGGGSSSAADISQMNFLLGELYARACQSACRRLKVLIDRLQLIGCHGQTIYHQPSASDFCGSRVRSTLQIGDASIIAGLTGVTTIGDFRPADMAAGGQGAPLVPFFDYLLYRDAKKGRVVLNIGGIANVTAIPAGGGPEDIIGFDTGPGNMLMDAVAQIATGGKLKYDRGGKIAASGQVSRQGFGPLDAPAILPPTSSQKHGAGAVRAIVSGVLLPQTRFRPDRCTRHRNGVYGRIHSSRHRAVRPTQIPGV